MEKGSDNNPSPDKESNDSPPFYDRSGAPVVHDGRIGEATDMYGDIATAEDYGYVARGCAETKGGFPTGCDP